MTSRPADSHGVPPRLWPAVAAGQGGGTGREPGDEMAVSEETGLQTPPEPH